MGIFYIVQTPFPSGSLTTVTMTCRCQPGGSSTGRICPSSHTLAPAVPPYHVVVTRLSNDDPLPGAAGPGRAPARIMAQLLPFSFLRSPSFPCHLAAINGRLRAPAHPWQPAL